MKRLFIQIYLGVMVAAVLGLIVSWVLVRAGYESQRLPDEIAYVELIHPLIVEDLRDAEAEAWPGVLEWWEGVSEFSLRVLAKDDPFWDDHEYLEPPFEELVLAVHTDFRSAYSWAAYAIPNSDQVIYYSYVFDASPLYMFAEIAGNVAIFTALGCGIYVLLLPIIRSTRDLTSTAQAYAEGRLDARATVRGPGPLGRLSSQFNQMAAEIQQRMREQEVMTTAISHELKTPLTRLRLALDMALASHDDAERTDMLREMDHDLDDLDSLTAELLTLAKLTYTGEPLELQPVVLAEVFEQLIPKLADLEPRVKISLSGAGSACCLGHYEHLMRAFSNLLTNGQRYADSAVQVEFVLEQSAVVVWVDDDGKGVPPERREEVFMPFARLDRSRNRDTGGFGLGLAIAKQSLEVQGGTIRIEESPMGGARFVVRLPKA